MTIKLDEDNITVSPTQIDDTDSPYLTNGEQYIYVNTTNGPVTIQLASSDTVDGAEIRIIDTGESASNNNITIQTEGSENINPGSNSSITLTVDGTYVDLFSDGNNWFSDRAVEKTSGQISGLQSLSTGDLVVNDSVSGTSIVEYETKNTVAAGSGKTYDTGISADFDGVIITANFKQPASGALGQYAWFAYSVDTRSPSLIGSNPNGNVSNQTVKAPNDTFELQFDADADISRINGVVIGFGR